MSLDNRPPDTAALRSIDDLVAFFRSGEKPATALRVGMEHEKIGLLADTVEPIPYGGPRGIAELLGRLARFGYTPWLENGRPIAATQPQLSISLEPGGQLELSGRPFHCCNDLAIELRRHLALIRALGAELGHAWLAVGYRPFGTPADAQWMPKGRYARMRAHLGQTGRYGLDMMTMTATVQANFDYTDEADAARKLRCATRISPLVTALFANSPIRAGRKSGWLSFRTAVWREVDPARSGLRPEFLTAGFGYRAYAEWALDVPLIFVRRRSSYHDPRGLTFRRFLADGFDGPEGHISATLSDWEDHLTTLFPEIRLKKVVEVRGADVGDGPRCLALPALWKGLFYDRQALEAAAGLVADLDFAALLDLQEAVGRAGLAARAGRRSVGELCRELLALSAAGLEGQAAAICDCGPSEARFLEPLQELIDSGQTLADRTLAELDGAANGDVGKLLPRWRIA